jgi:sterol desaturase/sphingolipid hydroxylase (fatty acid hydroxylase superfamily)
VSDAWRELLAAALGICIAAGLVVALLELVWLRRHGRLDRAALREMALSLSPVPPHFAMSLALAGVWTALFGTAHHLAPWHWPINAAVVALAAVATDLAYYWEHRCAHRIGLLWRAYHAMHHAAPQYAVATAYRVRPFSQLLAPAFYLPLVLAGVHPLLVVLLQQCCFHWQAWLHTEMIGELGWIDHWFNTPAAHRVHHSAALAHRDRNLGAVTLLWDRAFGTFATPSRDVEFGIAAVPAPRTWLDLYRAPWRH